MWRELTQSFKHVDFDPQIGLKTSLKFLHLVYSLYWKQQFNDDGIILFTR